VSCPKSHPLLVPMTRRLPSIRVRSNRGRAARVNRIRDEAPDTGASPPAGCCAKEFSRYCAAHNSANTCIGIAGHLSRSISAPIPIPAGPRNVVRPTPGGVSGPASFVRPSWWPCNVPSEPSRPPSSAQTEKPETVQPDPGTSVCLTHNIVPGPGHASGAGGLYAGLSAVSHSRFLERTAGFEVAHQRLYEWAGNRGYCSAHQNVATTPPTKESLTTACLIPSVNGACGGRSRGADR